VGSGAHKSCQISETVQDRTKVTITILLHYITLHETDESRLVYANLQYKKVQ